MPNYRNSDRFARSAFDAYMEQARKIPLLTAAQELELAKQAQHGGAVGKRARDTIITANLRFVVCIAWRHANNHVVLEDLVQEGNLGLLKAIEKFDHRRGFRLLTYAHWWIEQGMRNYLDNNSFALKVPERSRKNIAKMNKAVTAILERGEQPTDQAVACQMGVDVGLVRDLAQLSRHPISVHTPVFDGEELVHSIEDKHAVSPESAAIEMDFKDKLAASLGRLTDRQRQVITLRFGLDARGERTLEEVGQMFNLTRERIRQIEAKTLEILGCGHGGRTLKAFL